MMAMVYVVKADRAVSIYHPNKPRPWVRQDGREAQPQEYHRMSETTAHALNLRACSKECRCRHQ